MNLGVTYLFDGNIQSTGQTLMRVGFFLELPGTSLQSTTGNLWQRKPLRHHHVSHQQREQRRTPEYSLICLRRLLPNFGVFYPAKLGSFFILFFLRPAARAAQANFYPLGGSGLLVISPGLILSSEQLMPATGAQNVANASNKCSITAVQC